ncbi:MAG: diguanylate cyclase [Phycisphaeraceae bacterium]
MSEHVAPQVLLVEDDMDTAALVRVTLANHFGVDRVTHVNSAGEAMRQDLSEFDLVLSDLNLPDGSGLELIDAMLSVRMDIPIVMVTSEGALEKANQAIRKGAYDYVVKAGDYLFSIPLVVEKNLAIWQMKLQNMRLHQELEQTLEELRIKNHQLEEAVDELERQAATDPLTGVANRRHIEATLERTYAEAVRYGTDLACLMIDLDAFKQFNDSRGHIHGDRLLQMMAKVLTVNCRRCDVPGRYGGDEFVVLMPHTTPTVGQQVGRRIMNQFVGTVRAAYPGETCGISIGVACLSLSRPASADQLVALADRALYEAKQQGKGRIVVHMAEQSQPDIPRAAQQV